jgi:hypothetical protein
LSSVQNDSDGKLRIYFQNKDYQIYEMSLNDPKSTTHTLQKLTNEHLPAARINTPIAAVACNNLQEIRVFYIAVNSHVQELCYSQRRGWQKGSVIGTAVENSACLYAEGRLVHNEIMLRVGFQAAAAPQTITEAYTVKDEWKTRVL